MDQAKYGQTPIQNVAAEYGLTSPTNIDLPDEATGRVDSPEVRKQLHAEDPKAFPQRDWYTGDNIEMAFGQGSTSLTPIALANAYATFANGGTRYAPEVAAAVVTPEGKVVVRYTPRVLGHVNLPASVRDPILQGLSGVVQSPNGTGYCHLPGVLPPLSRHLPDRRQDRYGEQRRQRGAKLPVRGLWADHAP